MKKAGFVNHIARKLNSFMRQQIVKQHASTRVLRNETRHVFVNGRDGMEAGALSVKKKEASTLV